MGTKAGITATSWHEVDALIAMLRAWGINYLAGLEHLEVLAQLGKGRYPRLTPQRFSERYQAVRKLL